MGAALRGLSGAKGNQQVGDQRRRGRGLKLRGGGWRGGLGRGRKDELHRLGEGDVGRGLLLQLSQTQMTAPAPWKTHIRRSERVIVKPADLIPCFTQSVKQHCK